MNGLDFANCAVVVAGNLSDGFTHFGPFNSFDDAVEWADTNQKFLPGLGEYWVATCYTPKDKEPLDTRLCV